MENHFLFVFTLDSNGVRPDPDLEIPDSLHGVITSLATHQTLLGDAIATGDPKIFANALFAYPDRQNTLQARMLWKELLKIHSSEIPPKFQTAVDYF